MNTVRILTIGDELLSGFTADTNSAFMARQFSEAGYSVMGIESVGDEAEAIIRALGAAAYIADIVVISGGLGPTHDDLTKKAAAEYFNSELIFSQPVWDGIVERFSGRGGKISDSNRCQAEIIAGADVIPNTVGTAPCLHITRSNVDFFFLPGVPAEMRTLIKDEIIPRLNQQRNRCLPKVTILKTIGIPESRLYDQVRDFFPEFPAVKIAFLPQHTGVDLRLTITGDETTADFSDQLRLAERLLREKIGSAVYGCGDDTLPEVVARLLIKSSRTIAVAESCTGGLISNLLTNVPGSSDWFERGFVTYSNAAKCEHLNVEPEIISTYGAVSRETALAMAAGVRSESGTDIGLATTGIAGPGGGTKEKPVGLVYIAFACKDGIVAEKHKFFNQRLQNKHRFADTALDLVRRKLTES